METVYFQNRNKKHKGPRIIKKYGNRKLYDTELSSYIVLKDIEKMIRDKEEIQVIDNDTQTDITISTLTQIIFTSEKRSKHSPPIEILKSIIQGGDGSISSFLAKLGLFSEKDQSLKNQAINTPSAKALNSSKKSFIQEEEPQNLEQKITHLINSDDALKPLNNEDSIPNLLPGNHYS